MAGRSNGALPIGPRWRPAALPFVKWAGGKRWFVETLRALAPPSFERYLEPFLGGGAVALALAHSPMLLNDANADLMAAYQAVRDDFQALLSRLDTYRGGHSHQQFFSVRSLNPESLPLVERAARMIYLNKTCFNGLWRVNRRGEFNTPLGDALDPVLYDYPRIERANQVLQGAHLLADDYALFLDRHARAGDFIYLDPPYVPVGTYADFKRYTREQFREADQIKLAEIYHELIRRGAYPVLTNADTDVTRWLYRDHQVHVIQARRAINHDGDRRGPVPEIVVVPGRLPT